MFSPRYGWKEWLVDDLPQGLRLSAFVIGLAAAVAIGVPIADWWFPELFSR